MCTLTHLSNMLYCKSILILLLSTLSLISLGQNPSSYGIKTHYGIILPHSSDLKEISSTNPWGIEVDYSKLKTSQKAWDNCNCYSYSGVSFSYINYQNPEQLGNSYNLLYYAEPLITFKKKLFYSFRAGVGLSFLDTVFDEETNPENTFFSSPISFLLLANFNVNYKLSPHYTLKATANYNHISNGGMSQPNKGMNFPTLSLGITYTPEDFTLEQREKQNSDKGKLNGYLRFFGTMPEVETPDIETNERRLLIGLSGGAIYYVTHTNALNLGLEITNDEAVRKEAELDNASYDHRSVGLTLGHNFVFGNITFNQQIGYYLYKPFPSSNKTFFQRYELLYKLGKRYQIGTSLKAHGHVAENMDIRFGILF